MERSRITEGQRTMLCFAHPYCSSERGSSENHNGTIRRFLPKGTDFSQIARKRVGGIQDWMSAYPRRILGGLIPLQAFKREFGQENTNIKILEVA